MTSDPRNDPRFQELAAREWLETNGLGSYASGTVSGAQKFTMSSAPAEPT